MRFIAMKVGAIGSALLSWLVLVFVAESSHSRADDPAQTPAPSAPAESDEQAPDANFKLVRGRVVDEADAPVSDARLWLPLRYQPRRVVEATADPSGRFEFKIPAGWIDPRTSGSSWTIWAYAPGHGIATQSPFDVIRGDSDREITIQLAPPSHTRFRILTPAGEPLAGAVVQPKNYQTTEGYSGVPDEMIACVSARTDAEGVATLAAIRLKPLFRIQIVSEQFGKQSIRVDRNLNQPVREIRLRPTGKIAGRLTGDRPEWLRKVRLAFTVNNQEEWTIPKGEAEVFTDDDGRFEVPVIASGGPLHRYVFVDPALPVRPRLTDDIFVVDAGETLRLEIPLVATVKVHGKVLAKNSGKPIANSEISLRYGGFGQHEQIVTNEEGRFEGRVLPGAVWVDIIVAPGDYQQLEESSMASYQVPEGVEEFELPTIEVVATHEIRGTLIGAQGEPLEARQVIAFAGNRRYGFAKTDAEGQFTMRVPDGVETQIEVYTEERGQEPVTVVEREPLVVRFDGDALAATRQAERNKKPDVILTGRVLSEGKPLSGVKLSLQRGEPVELPAGLPGGAGQRRGGMRMLDADNAVTDDEGAYRLSGVKAGEPYKVMVIPPFPAIDPTWKHQSPYIPKLPDDAAGEVALPDMNLRKLTQTLAGTVVDPDDNPVEGAIVFAKLLEGFMSLPHTSQTAQPPWTMTDKKGRFKLQQLPDEPLKLMAYMPTKGGGPIRFPAKVDAELNQQDIRLVLDPSLVEAEE